MVAQRKENGIYLVCIYLALLVSSLSFADDVPDVVPDIRDDESKITVQKGDLVFVPIPFSNPTLDTGLLVGSAYFHSQTEEQKEAQPASVTAAGGFYSSSESFSYGIAHQSYWGANKWRFKGVAAHVDLKLDLNGIDDAETDDSVNWFVVGDFFTADISRRIAGSWYAGMFGRYVAINDEIGTDETPGELDSQEYARSVGLGVDVEYDSRDKPLNSYSGRMFEVSALFNEESFGSTGTYESYNIRYRSYHSMSSSLVMTWEARACKRAGPAPLWDSCRVQLRGFAATDFLGRSSASAQIEARWRFNKKWGAVAFVGGGDIRESYNESTENNFIPSYGIGLRWMVLASQRINARLDYARSRDSDAFYLSFGEAF